MNTIGRIVCVFLIAVLVLCAVPLHGNFGFAALATAMDTDEIDSGDCGENVTWVLDSDGTLTVAGTGEMEDYGYQYLNQSILSGNAPWLAYYDRIRRVNIGAGVANVGQFAFVGCTALEEVSLADGVEIIDYSAFYNCTGLIGVAIPASVTNISNGAFYGCGSLSVVRYAGSKEAWSKIAIRQHNDPLYAACVHTGADEHVIQRQNFTAPTCTAEGYTTDTCSCGAVAVRGYVNPLGHTDMNNDSVCDICGNEKAAVANILARGFCGSAVTWILDSAGTLVISGSGTMDGYDTSDETVGFLHFDAPWYAYRAQIVRVVIEDGVANISGSAFSDCSALISVSIPNTVEIIADAFSLCEALADVYYDGSRVGWDAIEIVSAANSLLQKVNIHYVYPEHEHSDVNADGICDLCGDKFTVPARGDVDNDGGITAADARMILRAAVGLETLSRMQKNAADADGDKEITAADARMVLRISVGLDASSGEEEPDLPYQPGIYMVLTDGVGLNIRTAPGIGDLLAVVDDGTELEVLDICIYEASEQEDTLYWGHIQWENQDAYIAMYYTGRVY